MDGQSHGLRHVMPGQEGREAVCRWDEGPASCDFPESSGIVGDWTLWIHWTMLNTSCIPIVYQYTTDIDQRFSCSLTYHVFFYPCRCPCWQVLESAGYAWSAWSAWRTWGSEDGSSRRTEKVSAVASSSDHVVSAFASNIRCSTRTCSRARAVPSVSTLCIQYFYFFKRLMVNCMRGEICSDACSITPYAFLQHDNGPLTDYTTRF